MVFADEGGPHRSRPDRPCRIQLGCNRARRSVKGSTSHFGEFAYPIIFSRLSGMSSLRPQSATAFTVSTVWDKPERELRSAALDNAEPELVKPAAVLIADGNAGERHALGELVREKHGAVSLIHAADGAEALAALRRHEIGIALVDRCLRGLDGAEFLKSCDRAHAPLCLRCCQTGSCRNGRRWLGRSAPMTCS